MTRRSAREQALRRDGYRCQITGLGRTEEERAQLDVHHWKRPGMGGSKLLDDVDNLITLGGVVHRLQVHPGVSVPEMRIVHWDPHDKENGLVVERRTADGYEVVPKDQLWFYQRQEVELLEEEIEMLRRIQTTEPARARIVSHIWDNYHLISDAASAEQFVGSLGLDTNKTREIVKAHKWIDEHGLEWPPLVNATKVNLIRRAYPNGGEAAQDLLRQAADASYTDLREALSKNGAKPNRMRFYAWLKKNGGVQYIRSRDRDAVMSQIPIGDTLLEINAFRKGIRWDRRTHALYNFAGIKLPVLEIGDDEEGR